MIAQHRLSDPINKTLLEHFFFPFAIEDMSEFDDPKVEHFLLLMVEWSNEVEIENKNVFIHELRIVFEIIEIYQVFIQKKVGKSE